MKMTRLQLDSVSPMMASFHSTFDAFSSHLRSSWQLSDSIRAPISISELTGTALLYFPFTSLTRLLSDEAIKVNVAVDTLPDTDCCLCSQLERAVDYCTNIYLSFECPFVCVDWRIAGADSETGQDFELMENVGVSLQHHFDY